MLSSRSLKLSVLGAILGLTPLVAGCSRETGNAAQPAATQSPETAGSIDRSHKGSAMPDLVFADAAGRELRLIELKGKPVLLNLWATWCAPCVAEMPALDRLAAAQEGKLHVVAISQDMQQPEKVSAFFSEKRLTRLKPWLDPQNQLTDHYRPQAFPITVYYDARGQEVWRFNGPYHWDKDAAAMLAEAQ